MYDYIRCEAPLPLQGFEGREFQTKDTEQIDWCGLATYTITLDGRLLSPEGEPLDFTGTLQFYDWARPADTSSHLRRFNATFVDGRLQGSITACACAVDEDEPAPASR